MRFIQNGFIISFLVVLVMGCQKIEEIIEVDETAESSVTFIDGWQEEFIVRVEDSFLSSFNTLLNYYGYVTASTQEQTYVGLPLYGVSYLRIIERYTNPYGLLATVVDGSFETVVEEIKYHRPVISKRLVRNISEDYVLITGYDKQTDELIGFTNLSKDPLRISKTKWDQEYTDLGRRWSLVIAADQDHLRNLRESSVIYWLQRAVNVIDEQNYEHLVEVIENLDRLNVQVSPANNIRSFYYLIVKQEVPDVINDHLNRLYDVAPDLSYSNEFMFHKHRILGDQEKAMEYMERIKKLGLFHENHSETLIAFREIYEERGEGDIVEKISDILKARGEEK